MAIYDYICTDASCSHMEEVRHPIMEDPEITCTKCGTSARKYLSVGMVTIPGHAAASGEKKNIFGDGKKTCHQAAVPINIIDEKPEGGYRVTRIGKKGDIDGD